MQVINEYEKGDELLVFMLAKTPCKDIFHGDDVRQQSLEGFCQKLLNITSQTDFTNSVFFKSIKC